MVGQIYGFEEVENVSGNPVILITARGNTGAALADALASGASVQIPPDLTSISVDAADVFTVLRGLSRIKADAQTDINLPAGVHTTASGNIGQIGPAAWNLRVLGASTISTTLVAVTSVTGTAGAWSVTLQVADGTGVSVGQILRLTQAVPLPTLSGDQSVFRKRMAENEVLNCSALLGTVTAATGANTVVWSSASPGTVLGDVIQAGDRITIKGQTNKVVSVDNGTRTATMASVWDNGISGSRAYWAIRPNSGTISTGGVASATVTGTGTAFTTQANAGDLLHFDGQAVLIQSVDSATQLTMSHPVTIAAATEYGVQTAAVAHEGAHEVTAVAGNLITVTNRYNGVFPPPVNRVSGGQVTVVRTVLKNTGAGDGLLCDQSAALAYMDRVAIQGGRNSTGTHGLAMNGRLTEGPTQKGYVSSITLGDDVVFLDWGRGVFMGHGDTLQSRKLAVSGCLENAVWLMEGANADLRACVISGAASRNCIIGSGSMVLATDGRFIGGASDGVYGLPGSSFYGEIPFLWGNRGMNARVEGAAAFYANEGVSIASSASGIILDSAAQGQIKRMLIAGNSRAGIEASNRASVAADEAWLTGSSASGGDGAMLSDCEVNLTNGASTGNRSWGVDATGLCLVSGEGVVLRANTDGSARAQNGADVALSGGAALTVTVASGGVIRAASMTTTPTITGANAFNRYGDTGGAVLNNAMPPQAGAVVATSTLGASTNDWTPTGYVAATTEVLVAPSGAFTVTGLTGGNGGERRTVFIQNTSTANTVTLANNSGLSSAANRFLCAGNADIVIPVLGRATLTYDGAPYSSTNAWRVVLG